MGDPSEREDAGLQPERTTLALTRTSMLMFATAVLLARMAYPDSHAVAVVALISLIVPVALLATERHRHGRSVRAFQRGYQPPPIGRSLVLVGFTEAIAALGMFVIATRS